MLTPINNHILIEPVAQESFVASAKETYEEIGIVLDAPEFAEFKVGDRVYFDSWLAAKYPVQGERDKFYWLVQYENIRAYEKVPK